MDKYVNDLPEEIVVVRYPTYYNKLNKVFDPVTKKSGFDDYLVDIVAMWDDDVPMFEDPFRHRVNENALGNAYKCMSVEFYENKYKKSDCRRKSLCSPTYEERLCRNEHRSSLELVFEEAYTKVFDVQEGREKTLNNTIGFIDNLKDVKLSNEQNFIYFLLAHLIQRYESGFKLFIDNNIVEVDEVSIYLNGVRSNLYEISNGVFAPFSFRIELI